MIIGLNIYPKPKGTEYTEEDSFTQKMLDSFVKGVEDVGNECIISDLYKMDFKTDTIK